MKVGEVEFEVECDETQLQSAVSKILNTVTEKLKETPFLADKSTGMQRAETCKSIIQELWDESFFAIGRDLGEVHAEMARRGFHYDRTAVAHALIDLVKDNILTREGKPRRYLYAQKHPPPSITEGAQKQVPNSSVGKEQE